MATSIRLLGAADIERDGDRRPLPRDKRGALLFYLAESGGWIGRDRIAFLFWPDRSDSEARRNLRQLLRRVRELDLAGEIEIDREQLRWRVDSDVAAFRAAIEGSDWPRALDRYGGALGEGFSVADALGFDSWMEQRREGHRSAWHAATLAAAAGLSEAERHAEAARLLAPLWSSDPLDEQALHAYLRALHGSGEREAALAAFERFRTLLEGELGVEPLAETLLLIEAIRSGTPDPAQAETPAEGALPEASTPFIGREADLRDLTALADDPACQLLAVVGPGGSGKSRLTLELARHRHDRYHDGVRFVTLEQIGSQELLVAALADAVGFAPTGGRDPADQLGDYLRDRELLLVLDGFEHLTEGVGLVVDYLEQAPGLQLLLSSREAPDLPQAWIYRLEGLDRDGADPEASEAFRLFLQAAQRSDPRYRLRRDDVPDIVALCRITEGLPLALEMAAGWIRQLSPREIGEEIQLNLDFLGANVPDRGSMRAVFEHSWSLLSPELQRALRQLATFRDGFDRHAAQGVAGVGLYALLALVGKSLLHKERSGRYRLHELTRGYALERLLDADEHEAVRRRHADHFTARLADLGDDLIGPGLSRLLATVGADLDNVRAAWDWALERGAVTPLLAAARPLAAYLTHRSLFREGERLFAAAATLPATGGTSARQLRAEALGQRGAFAHRLGDNRSAFTDLQRSLELFERLGDARATATARVRLAQLALATADYDAGERHANAGLEAARTVGDNDIEAAHLRTLGQIAVYRGAYDHALGHLEGALTLSRRRGDRLAEVAALDGIGTALSYLGRHDDARRVDLEAHAVHELEGNPNALARSRYRLGAAAFQQSEPDEAETHFRAAADSFADIGNRRALAGALQGLAGVAFVRRDYLAGREHLEEALAIFEALGHRQGIAEMLHKIALFAKLGGDHVEAERRYRSSLAIAREIGARRDEVLCLDGLAHLASDGGDREVAWERTRAALTAARELGSDGLLLHCLLNALRLLEGAERHDEALTAEPHPPRRRAPRSPTPSPHCSMGSVSSLSARGAPATERGGASGNPLLPGSRRPHRRNARITPRRRHCRREERSRSRSPYRLPCPRTPRRRNGLVRAAASGPRRACLRQLAGADPLPAAPGKQRVEHPAEGEGGLTWPRRNSTARC
jgi:predicted ATPase/DNA-binding SARP family transcriptional activator